MAPIRATEEDDSFVDDGRFFWARRRFFEGIEWFAGGDVCGKMEMEMEMERSVNDGAVL